MLDIVSCIVYDHNLWLVILAGVVCLAGSSAVIRLLTRASMTVGVQKWGWHFLTASAAGTSIWCTHFIAMLGFEPGVPVGFDPSLTAISLVVAVLGTSIGFIVATIPSSSRVFPVFGGAIVGCSIAAMHYIGMLAYRVKGLVTWDLDYLLASIVLCVVLAGASVQIALRGNSLLGKYTATGFLTLTIVSLHFTGMTAFQVTPMMVEGSFSTPDALHIMALCVAGVALVIVGAGLASFIIDDSVRADSLEKLRHMAMNDALTGLPNRSGFNNQLEREITVADVCNDKFALICIDLDRFKEVNDLRGHATGDEVLKLLAQRMSDLLEAGEFVARLGGDEFGAIQRFRDQSALLNFINRLEKVLFQPIQLADFQITTGASFGIALYPDDADCKSSIVNNADLAMYRAKKNVNTSVCFYEKSMDNTIKAQRKLAVELRDALENGQLDVHYQVQTSISTGEIQGYEALLRWEHPERGSIPPSEFIPLAEENGFILNLGEWVLYEACSKAVTWNPSYKVAINLSPVQLGQEDLPDVLLNILQKTGLNPGQLELELTETAIVTGKERALHILRQIKAMGVGIALDDFGTGYSSLETLRTFPFDKIKLDRTFISEVETSHQAKAIIRAVMALGRSLEVPILAEGIETRGQMSLLVEEGCDEAQGFLIGKPIPHSQLVLSGQITTSDEQKLMVAG